VSTIERVRALCEPIAADLDVELFDLEQAGGTLRVTLDQEGGVSIDVIAEATRRISRALDEHDPITGHYTLEVSSPGLERVLRTPAHWRWAVGREVTVKVRPQVEGERRLRGIVRAADDDGFTLALDEPVGDERRLTYDQIDKARTVFEWGPAPKPGGKGGSTRRPLRGTTSEAEVETT
jgi:ribosome maturation factor RimP